ncbi:actin nucleation-promoting factor WASL-like [Carassius carassius]|uniref:actin nucleation-promoting factor WASL-like n=1 Tax=Carassius carassius TaxID=217509 RepID=UPI00286869A7|nr:actin nucleation-promoting factor WASL-like [Carassius carassius]
MEDKEMSRISSSLLSTRENGLLFSLLSHDCSVLACGIVQLVMAVPRKNEWKSHSFGVLCLTQDKSVHSTFMRLYCLKKAKLQWEQELYTPFEYSETCPYFHTFPGDECQIGINFADEDEAKQFYIAVQKQISDNKASHSGLTRRYSVGGVSDWKEKLNNCLKGNEVHKSFSLRSSSRVPHRLDSNAAFPESRPTVASTMSSQSHDLSQTLSGVNEESMSLAQRKGPLPPIPIHARIATLKFNPNASIQNFDSTIPKPPLVPPPPSYQAPAAPPSSAIKDPYSAGMKQNVHYNARIEDESGYDDYL